MRDLISNDVRTAAYLAVDDFPPDRPDPSEYLDEPIDGDDLPYDEDDAPAWAQSESEQEWRAEMREDALQGGEL